MTAFDSPEKGKVKIIIATNAAESSVTLPDVDHAPMRKLETRSLLVRLLQKISFCPDQNCPTMPTCPM
eukprot:8887803-Ditylum_brightwellii.AAC.1